MMCMDLRTVCKKNRGYKKTDRVSDFKIRCSIRFLRVNRINYLLFIFILRQPHDPYLVDSPVCHFQYGYV